MNIVSDESVGSLEVMFTFARCCVGTPLLVRLPRMRISRRSASERVEFRPFTRATVRACCSCTSS